MNLGCEAAFENLFSVLKSNRWVGDFQVATSGGFWVATREIYILCRYRYQRPTNIPVSNKERTLPKINTMSFLYNAYDRINSIPLSE